MVNGTAESRSHWVTYALGTTATAVFGTKGVGAAATKAALQKSVTATQNALHSLRTLELPQLLPYTPRLELALPDGVPVNVVDGNQLKVQLMLMAKRNGKGAAKPLQKHHYATNKNKKYTPQMENITKKYDLDLDDGWNKELLPHQGRHPNAYHDYVLDKLSTYDRLAKGDRKKFLKLYEGLKQEVRDNLAMLYKEYWRSK